MEELQFVEQVNQVQLPSAVICSRRCLLESAVVSASRSLSPLELASSGLGLECLVSQQETVSPLGQSYCCNCWDRIYLSVLPIDCKSIKFNCFPLSNSIGRHVPLDGKQTAFFFRYCHTVQVPHSGGINYSAKEGNLNAFQASWLTSCDC